MYQKNNNYIKVNEERINTMQNEIDLIKALEQLNMENKQILNSKEYKLGHQIYALIRDLKCLNIKRILKTIVSRRRNRKDIKKFYMHSPRENIVEYVEDFYKKKIVVYTCITGNYDKIEEPLYVPSNVHYILYTNLKKINTKKWTIKEIPHSILKMQNNVLINRYIKMHPQELFQDLYDYAIYIDGNIRTISDISSFTTKINSITGLALHRHYVRDCIYLEAEACKLHKKGNIAKLQEQIERYKTEDMPKNYGLLEANVIVTDLKSKNAREIEKLWWEEFIKSESNRDQISLIYVLWKLGYGIDNVGNLGYNVRKNYKITINNHLE